jgi:uncharacterized protein (TIGR02118 family)
VYRSGYKLVIVFKQQPRPEEFERRWAEEFVPLAEQLPGLQRVVVSRMHGGPAGRVDILLIHELHFADQAALNAAMRSPAGVATGECLVRIAGRLATLAFAEHMEDQPTTSSPPFPQGEGGRGG